MAVLCIAILFWGKRSMAFTPLWAAAHLPHKGGDQLSQLFQLIFKDES
jgi:hypothetical protein